MGLITKWGVSFAVGALLVVGCSEEPKRTCTGSACDGFSTFESYDAGTWVWSPWFAPVGSTGGGSPLAACAHDGARGMRDPSWYYRTDVLIGAAGDAVQQWAMPGSTGRVYLGFGSNAAGTWSLTLGPNTGELLIQRIEYGTTAVTYTDLATSPQAYASGTWYLMRVVFGSAGAVTGELYASDGVTLVNSVSATLGTFAPGGVAIRSFGTSCFDTMQF